MNDASEFENSEKDEEELLFSEEGEAFVAETGNAEADAAEAARWTEWIDFFVTAPQATRQTLWAQLDPDSQTTVCTLSSDVLDWVHVSTILDTFEYMDDETRMTAWEGLSGEQKELLRTIDLSGKVTEWADSTYPTRPRGNRDDAPPEPEGYGMMAYSAVQDDEEKES